MRNVMRVTAHPYEEGVEGTMAVWVVRAGREGAEEPIALNEGIAVIGWDALGDLSGVKSRDELAALYGEKYPGDTPPATSNQVSQIWNFLRNIAVGDTIVLPLKTSSGQIAVGRVEGDYQYRPNSPDGAHHTRGVNWISKDLPRSSFKEDLITAFNRPMTVIPVHRPETESRVQAVVDGRMDPGAPEETPPTAVPEVKDLRDTFEQWRARPRVKFEMKLRRWRCEQLRELLSNPDAIDQPAFDHEVWRRQDTILVRRQEMTSAEFDARDMTPDQLSGLEQALDAGEIEYHGNSVWGAGTHVYGAGLKVTQDQKEGNIREALRILNGLDNDPVQKAKDIMDVPGFGPNIATGLVMAFHPDSFALYNAQTDGALKKLGRPVGTLEEFEEIAANLREELGASDFLELDRFLEQINRGEVPLPTTIADPGPVPWPIKDLAARLYVTPEWLEEIRDLLAARRQVIFYGPPGTGKTYIARELSQLIAGDLKRVRIVQFHPSYSYEDFVEGYRPYANEHAGVFKLEEGPLLEIAAQAGRDSDNTYILLIDEINRGNLARVFGEMYFLLEYRSEQMRLLYSPALFSLPENLWIIGTMNTADRSIALVDAALRRRFFFIPFFANDPPINSVLRGWLTKNKPDLGWVADVVDLANQQIGDRNAAIGPSYFMRPELDERWVGLIWTHSVIPYLEEQFFGEESRLKDFSLEKLRAQLSSTTKPASQQPSTAAEAIAHPTQQPNVP